MSIYLSIYIFIQLSIYLSIYLPSSSFSSSSCCVPEGGLDQPGLVILGCTVQLASQIPRKIDIDSKRIV